MDDLLSPSSSFVPPSPSSHFSTVGQQVLEFVSREIPEQWLFDDGTMSQNADRELAELSELPPSLPATLQCQTNRRGRKTGPRSDGRHSAVSHVQAERLRRDKLNRRFCDLRAAVPNVSRMDKASLLADAVAYIAELRSRVARLGDEANKELEQSSVAASKFVQVDEAVDVRMVGSDAAAVRVTTAASHAPARLMGALRSLELQVQHACVSRVQGVTLQDVVVDVPPSMQDADGLRSALLQTLQDSA
ncbi:hypothetical protein CFC21_025296 [Triticum aestivum]|uniref:Transcription factor n=2 Tax=Triticum aestivum TaxID=4565 RepID=A0A341ZFK4_WHEAT|nr:hypothetical protein CFC21_025296 [Triticum aestivum]